jgi:hypothetical protein
MGLQVSPDASPDALLRRSSGSCRSYGVKVYWPNGKEIPAPAIEIISGHHRVRAARAAGLMTIWVLVDRGEMTRSKVVAKQLAHNALIGHDDEEIVRSLVQQLDGPDDLLHSGLPEDMMPTIESEAVGLFLPHADFDWRHVGFAVLPHQQEHLEELCKRLEGRHDMVLLMMPEQFQSFVQSAAKYARLKDIRSGGTVVSVLTELALAELGAAPEDPSATDGERWVPLASVLGTLSIPEDAAGVIVQAIEKAKEDGDLTERNAWQIIEKLAADYLAGP